MNKLFLTSDFHFSHKNIIKYCNRPFSSVEEMDKKLIQNINDIVGEEDVLWFLGDFCFARHDYFEVAKRYRDRIHCKNVSCIFGNHDGKEIAPLFSSAQDYAEIKWQGQMIVVCHYLMAVWNRSHHGAIHCYGHSHSTVEKWADKVMPGRRSIDVGVDNAAKILGEYRPFSFEEIMGIMKNKKGHSIDHHGKTDE